MLTSSPLLVSGQAERQVSVHRNCGFKEVFHRLRARHALGIRRGRLVRDNTVTQLYGDVLRDQEAITLYYEIMTAYEQFDNTAKRRKKSKKDRLPSPPTLDEIFLQVRVLVALGFCLFPVAGRIPANY